MCALEGISGPAGDSAPEEKGLSEVLQRTLLHRRPAVYRPGLQRGLMSLRSVQRATVFHSDPPHAGRMQWHPACTFLGGEGEKAVRRQIPGLHPGGQTVS